MSTFKEKLHAGVSQSVGEGTNDREASLVNKKLAKSEKKRVRPILYGVYIINIKPFYRQNHFFAIVQF